MVKILSIVRKEKNYFLFVGISFLVVFAIALVQNVIRYGIHEGYNPWHSVAYLSVSLLLFLPQLPILVWALIWGLGRFDKYYWFRAVFLGGLTIGIQYIGSSFVIHLLGFYDEFFTLKYARSYFGREALYHVMAIVGTTFYVFYTHQKVEQKKVSGTVGRKELTVPVNQIRWIEADDHYLKIHTQDQVLLKRYTLEKMTEDLKPEFVRIHRKYLVNKKMIVGTQRVKRNEFIVLNSGECLKVGRSFQPIEF